MAAKNMSTFRNIFRFVADLGDAEEGGLAMLRTDAAKLRWMEHPASVAC
jgi:hypothetical protein